MLAREVDAVEALEDVEESVRRDPGPGVVHAQANLISAPFRSQWNPAATGGVPPALLTRLQSTSAIRSGSMANSGSSGGTSTALVNRVRLCLGLVGGSSPLQQRIWLGPLTIEG